MFNPFEELKVGIKKSIAETATLYHLQKYANISGDYNAVHFNLDYIERNFDNSRGNVMHGLFIEGLISKLLGVELPGDGTVLINMNIDFLEPVYIGDIIRAEAEIVEIKREKRIIKLKVDCNMKLNN